jgi:4-amino-4-deoxy-L-arabinose transferase-like glycosyltransferase
VPRLREIPKHAWIALAVIVLIGGGIRVYETTKPISRLSADALSYSSLGKNVALYGDFPQGLGPIRWPPGTPYMFAVAYRLAPGDYTKNGQVNYAPLRWAQFLVSIGTVLAVFLLAWLLVGPWAGVLAAAIIAFYPPLYWAPSNLLSEPLGGFLVTCAFAALAAGWRSRTNAWWFAAAGALLGGVLLTRTDLLFVPALLSLLVLVWLWRTNGWRRGLLSAAALAGATFVVILPWVVHASDRAGRLVPITQGGGSAFFVGTYLPGNGSTYGLKAALLKDVRAAHPSLRHTYYKDIPAKLVLDTVAARHPEMSRDNALLAEAQKNLKNDVLHHPAKTVRLWWTKFRKMWFRATLGGAHHPMHVLRVYHFILVLLAMIGLLVGIVRRRDPALVSILVGLGTATAVHLIAVANGRYGLPLMAILVAGGIAGWWTLVEDLRARKRAGPEAAPEDERSSSDDTTPDAPPDSLQPA